MPELKFKACRLLLSNVWQKELTLIQRRILGALRTKRRAAEREVSRRENQHAYIRLQTTRRLSLFYGNIRMAEMRKARGDSSFISFLLHLETRLDVLLVRIHFCQSLAQARQLISHGKVCVNHAVANKIHWKVAPGSLVSWKEDEKRAHISEMPISVKTATGKIISLEVIASETIGDVKEKIQAKEGIPSNLQQIAFAAKQLKDEQTLASCDIVRDSVIHLALH